MKEYGNGYLNVAIGKISGTVYGGPYSERPMCMYGVRLAPEVNHPYDVQCPIRDFSVPNELDLENALYQLVEALSTGRTAYVGCMGGWGRTGLFLSCLTKLAYYASPFYLRWIDWVLRKYNKLPAFDAVQTVRDGYTPRAIETGEQHEWVNNWDPSDLIRELKREGII